MTLHVGHPCPQCGGEIVLEESDRVLSCPYCGVAHVLFTRGYVRLTLPLRHTRFADAPKWVPYLHFRGSAFWLNGGEVAQRVLHVSGAGIADPHVPPSLGLRSQTQRLRFLTASTPGTVTAFARTPADILRASLTGGKRHVPSAVAYIGETASLIYLPMLQTSGGWVDGVSGQLLRGLPNFPAAPSRATSPGALTFRAAICPHCGGDLRVEASAVAFPCSICGRVWETLADRFVAREVEHDRLRPAGGIHLPFWRLQVASHAPATMSELAAATGQPWPARRPPDEAWAFFCPAFKIRPRTLLRVCERLSLAPMSEPLREGVPEGPRHPVTLPSREAAEMLPVALASMAFDVKARARLFATRPEFAAVSLIYLGFAERGAEWVHDGLSLAINRSALAFGTAL